MFVFYFDQATMAQEQKSLWYAQECRISRNTQDCAKIFRCAESLMVRVTFPCGGNFLLSRIFASLS